MAQHHSWKNILSVFAITGLTFLVLPGKDAIAQAGACAKAQSAVRNLQVNQYTMQIRGQYTPHTRDYTDTVASSTFDDPSTPGQYPNTLAVSINSLGDPVRRMDGFMLYVPNLANTVRAYRSRNIPNQQTCFSGRAQLFNLATVRQLQGAISAQPGNYILFSGQWQAGFPGMRFQLGGPQVNFQMVFSARSIGIYIKGPRYTVDDIPEYIGPSSANISVRLMTDMLNII